MGDSQVRFRTVRRFIGIILLCTLSCGSLQTWKPYPGSTPTVDPNTVEWKSVGIRGIISRVDQQNGKIRSIFVVGTSQSDTLYTQAWIGFTANSLFFSKKDGSLKAALESDIQENKTVEVYFIGAVHTSDPVQATASRVIILQDPDE